MMTEALSKARQDISAAVQARIIELMATVVTRSAAAIADTILNECENALDEVALNDAIADQLGQWDFSPEVNLASCEVAAATAIMSRVRQA